MSVIKQYLQPAVKNAGRSALIDKSCHCTFLQLFINSKSTNTARYSNSTQQRYKQGSLSITLTIAIQKDMVRRNRIAAIIAKEDLISYKFICGIILSKSFISRHCLSTISYQPLN